MGRRNKRNRSPSSSDTFTSLTFNIFWGVRANDPFVFSIKRRIAAKKKEILVLRGAIFHSSWARKVFVWMASAVSFDPQ